jgi:acetyl-CoA synthetase
MKWGREIPDEHDLSSLRLLGSVGEPINPEAWRWYRDAFGANKTPVVDTWWQTETGAIMISPLPGVTETKPGSAMTPLPGISAKIVDEEGNELVPGADEGEHVTGYLVLDKPWPSMLRGIWGDPERYKETYWSRFSKDGVWKYFAGDGAHVDTDGDIVLLGRVDDVMNVSGHRLSTQEIESALVSNHIVAEAAVVGAADEATGQAVVAFVIIKSNQKDANTADEAVALLKKHVSEQIGAIARPRQIFIVAELPKTRSGKIMRRLLQDVAVGREIGDTTTLADTSVMQIISDKLR